MSREERIQAIRDGVAEKMSSTQIAEAIGGKCNRNMIIGLSYRSGIKLVATPASVAKMKADALFKSRPEKHKAAPVAKKEVPAKPPRAPAPLTAALAIRKPAIIDAEPVYEFPDLHYRVHLEDVKSGQCRAPTWNDDKRPDTAVYFFCGKPVKSGSPYCWHCHKKMYDGMPRRREPGTMTSRQTRRGELA
ncbi:MULTISPECIES: GcrA family cell cycle regulator [Mesorhizobium]|uniref:GcrA family cell cycle regulator n=1 Tax=Mesorhizobium TaxID=68287 RepID=UPI0013146226|nr:MULTISPECIES: GcrA family cell cycle regulator [Mesorhizobium]MDF3208409.1 GcrA family cell cycle regulator [Mesorhizobium sp. LMG15046]MDF3229020.1 GcrA family cell cycle regulator [Mesorhizobium sp. DSM 30133]